MENIEDIKSDFLRELKSLEEEFSKRIDEIAKESLENKKTAFEVGKWYKFNGGPAISCFSGDRMGRGITNENNWGVGISMYSPESWTPATKEEIESALIKEAERRGFKEGVKFKSVVRGYEDTCNGRFTYNENRDDLYSNGTSVFSSGKWAEIVKDEVIKIGGYEAKYSGDKVSFGCKSFTQGNISRLLVCMSEIGFTSIAIDHVTVSREDIEKIKKGFK